MSNEVQSMTDWQNLHSRQPQRSPVYDWLTELTVWAAPMMSSLWLTDWTYSLGSPNDVQSMTDWLNLHSRQPQWCPVYYDWLIELTVRAALRRSSLWLTDRTYTLGSPNDVQSMIDWLNLQFGQPQWCPVYDYDWLIELTVRAALRRSSLWLTDWTYSLGSPNDVQSMTNGMWQGQGLYGCRVSEPFFLKCL